MTWRRYAGLFAAFAAFKWLIGHRGEELATYVMVVLVVLVMVVGYLRHVRRQQTELAILQADSDERAQRLAALPPGQAAAIRFKLGSFEDIDLSSAPPPAEFRYPAGSRSLSTALFWLAAILAAGFLLPVVRGGITDQVSAIIFLALGSVMVLSVLGYRQLHNQIGTMVRVDHAGLTVVTTDAVAHLDWAEIVAVRYHCWAGAVDYESRSGKRVRVWLTLIDFTHFVELTLIHQHRQATVDTL